MANRVLKRPMFRMGGSPQYEFQEKTSGILSGMDGPKINASRTGYEEGGEVDYTSIFEDVKRQNDALKEKYGITETERKAGEPGSLSSALMNFGINLLAQPGGNLAGAIGKAGAPALQQFQAARRADKQQARKEKLDEFRDVRDTATDIFKEKEETRRTLEEAKLGGAQEYAKKQAANAIGEIARADIAAQEALLEGLTPNDPRRKDITNKIQSIKEKLKKDQIAIYTGAATDLEYQRDVISSLIAAGEDIADIALIFPNIGQIMGPGFKMPEMADGGRVGLQQGGEVMETVSESVDMMTQPSQTQDLTYNELRSRLPREISNDVVSLIATSKQALMDFAEIRTQQDVDNFNQLYNVNLVLPQEG